MNKSSTITNEGDDEGADEGDDEGADEGDDEGDDSEGNDRSKICTVTYFKFDMLFSVASSDDHSVLIAASVAIAILVILVFALVAIFLCYRCKKRCSQEAMMNVEEGSTLYVLASHG